MLAARDALQRNDEDATYGALVAALYGQTHISKELEDLILQCTAAASSKLRAIVYELAVHNDLDSVRQAHLHSNWKVASANKQTYESWFGSMLLIEAYARDELSVEDLLKRIGPETWFAAADRLGKTFTKSLVDVFVHQLRNAVVAVHEIQLPSADLLFSKVEPAPFPFLSIEETDRDGERFPKQRSLREALGADDDFDEKQDRLHALAKAFFEKLKGSDARFLIKQITIDELRRLVCEVPTLLSELVEILDQADSAQFIWLKNLAFAVANLISGQNPDHATSLLQRASTSQGFVTLALGDDLTLEHQATWGAELSQPMETLWRQRLLSSKDDTTLAREVLAAERFGAVDFIEALVLRLASSKDSLDQAYAISIAGYSNQSDKFAGIISKHIDDKGVTGEAAKHALTEHENAIWARHWVESMWDAPTQEEFWRCLIIAKTVMDARVSPEMPTNSRWEHYNPVFRRARKSAIKERNKKRDKRLLGQEVPAPIYISPID